MERTFFKFAIMNAIEKRKKKKEPTYSSRFSMAILFAKYLKNQDDFRLSLSLHLLSSIYSSFFVFYSLPYHLLSWLLLYYIFDRLEFPVHVRPFYTPLYVYLYSSEYIQLYLYTLCSVTF